jgi:hypothetical protein
MIFAIFLYKSAAYEIFSFHPQGTTRFLAKLLIFRENYLFYGLELTAPGTSSSGMATFTRSIGKSAIDCAGEVRAGDQRSIASCRTACANAAATITPAQTKFRC